ncbi:MAG: PKD domain-containing protein [Chitinophagales bacterium]
MKYLNASYIYKCLILSVVCLLCACDPCSTVANFDYRKADNSGTIITIGSEVSFTPDENDGLGYSWDFGQGNFSNSEKPTHTFWAAGNRRVTLTLLMEDGDCLEAVASENIVVETLEGTTSSFMMTGQNVSFYLIEEGEESEVVAAELEKDPYDAVIDTFETTGKTNSEKSYIFYTEKDENWVYRYDFETRESMTINENSSNPEYIDTDHKNNHVYWTGYYYDQIEGIYTAKIYRTDIDGNDLVVEQIYATQATEFSGLAIDDKEGILYFSDQYGIYKINLSDFASGTTTTNITAIYASPNAGITAIHFDEVKNRMYYVENLGEHQIAYLALDTEEINILGNAYNSLPVEAISVNNNENKIYWINQDAQTVERGSLEGFETYETAWILDVTNPRILELSEH